MMPALFTDHITGHYLTMGSRMPEATVQVSIFTDNKGEQLFVDLTEEQALAAAAKLVHSVYALRRGPIMPSEDMPHAHWLRQILIETFRGEAMPLLYKHEGRIKM